jgi:transcriptional regulator with XRE-family HTH domain
MDYLNENIKINLKRIRKIKNLSLDEMAMETGVSKSMLGQIERGEANPTITTLGKITSAMRISFSDLVGPPPGEFFVLKKETLQPLKEIPGNFKNFFYFPFETDRQFEIYSLEIEPNGCYECASHGEKTMEYLIIFSGSLYLDMGEHQVELKTGDAIRFNSDKAHAYYNKGTDQLRIYMLFTW